MGADGSPPPRRRLGQLAALEVDVLKLATPSKAKALREMEIASILDLVTTYPRRYLDRTRKLEVAATTIGDEVTILAKVTASSTRPTRGGKRIVEVTVVDDSGQLDLVFFNQPWRANQLRTGTLGLFFGKIAAYRGTRQMANPIVDVVAHDGMTVESDKMLRIVPVYPMSAKVRLTSYDLSDLIGEALRRAGDLADPLPEEFRTGLNLLERTEAFRQIHRPDSETDAALARNRLAFDELLRLQLALVIRRAVVQRESRGLQHQPIDLKTTSPHSLVGQLLATLAFPLTSAQKRVVGEISSDLSGSLPMHRLLQGDVGSGKTIVALLAILAVADSGHQGAMMVPTEVLAEQHVAALGQFCQELVVESRDDLLDQRPFAVALLTGKTPVKERRRVLEGLATGTIDLVVGTHALLTEEVAFRSLGLAVIDEQHRFGVEQRASLKEKAGGAHDPDLLVMTATPIPRTAAMVLFGDLDVSVIDALPAGRLPIKTTWSSTELLAEAAWAKVRMEVAAGRQAYVVCPLVEGSSKVEAVAVTHEVARLGEGPLKGLRLGLLHGQMKSEQRREVMEQFRSGDLDVLVATTVIEVGVDVPNATVMVIEDAARFGIAQLHQLRGRVGRGTHPSTCFLLGEATNLDATKRLAAIEASTDGFYLAEVDLEVRGGGTILGARQNGITDLRLASLTKDGELLVKAREVAEALVEAHPFLAGLPELADELRTLLDDDEADFLFKS